MINSIVTAINGTVVNTGLDVDIKEIVIDSRKTNENTILFALVGENLDGHKFISSAYENGCRCFVVNKSANVNIDKMKDASFIAVEDTTLALGDLAKYYKEQNNIPYIGVTGSVGKTTTKDMIYGVVSHKFNTLKNEGNFNNHIGVPLTLFNLRDSHECAIIEMGMSHFKEIEYLADMVNPQVGVISNIGLSHIENLGSQAGILEAKLEITKNFNENNLLVVNGDDNYLKTLKEKSLNYKLKTFGFDESNDIYCTEFFTTSSYTTFKCIINSCEEEFFVPSTGKHNIYNAMSAILVGLNLNMSIDEIREGLKNFKASKMRLDVMKEENITIINDAYNASPDSMKSSLEVLSLYDKNRKVAILGDMFEMGSHAQEGHETVGVYARNNCDVLITIGKDSKFIYDKAISLGFDSKNAYYFSTKEEAVEKLSNIIEKEDVVLLKASRGMQFEKLIPSLIIK